MTLFDWDQPAAKFWEQPLAVFPFRSFRYRGPFGWIMIGARDEADALRQAERSLDAKHLPAVEANLEEWFDLGGYVPVSNREEVAR